MFDKMIADMLGITPKEMQEMLSGMQTLLRDGVQKLNEIHAQNDAILARIDAIETAACASIIQGDTGNGGD